MDFGYLNARVRAWKGSLFREIDYNEFMSLDSLDGFIGKLKISPYGFDLEEAKASLKGRGEITIMDKGLKNNLSRILREIWSDSPSDSRTLVRCILSFWDIYNLKTILRGIKGGISPDEIYSILFPAGDFDDPALKELSQSRDVRLIIEILDTWGSPYAVPLKECMPDYQKNKEIIVMELTLDRFVYSFYLDLLDKDDINTSMVEELIKDRIDASNVITLFKFIKGKSSYPLINYYLKDGKRLTESNFVKLGGYKNEEELLRGLIEKIGDMNWRRVLEMVDLRDPYMLEEEMEALIGMGFCRKAVIHPLSIAVIICFYYRKIREIKNLRLLGRSKEYSIPPRDVKRYLL